jgi:hypothetical protein
MLVLSLPKIMVFMLCRYRHTSYHKQTKNQWARDDPAFLVVACMLLTVAAIAYAIACVPKTTGTSWFRFAHDSGWRLVR